MIEERDTEYDQDRVEMVADIQGFEVEESEEEREQAAIREWEEKLQLFGNGVEAEAQEFERHRMPVELRMLEDIRQYNGVQDDSTKRIKKPDNTGSGLNVNITRKKTNAAEARLSDMLFPTDEKNWALDPSPVPTLAIKGPVEAEAQPQPAPQPEQLPAPMGQPPQPGQAVEMGQPTAMPADPAAMQMQPMPADPAQPEAELLSEKEVAERNAKERAELMEKEIDDQLTECNYQASGREAIRYGCLLGTGVMKGPVLLGKGRRAWIEKKDDEENVAYVLQDMEDNRPGFELVPTWDFFPTMSATRIEDSDINFQRHWMTRRDLIRLAKRDDFMKNQIRRVLQQSPNRVAPDYLTELRNMSDISAVGDEKRYVVWERHGPVDVIDLQACGAIDHEAEVDELEEYQGVVWVCQGIVIKAAVNPMDTEDQPFSVFNFERDDSCIFGYGVPYLTREAQKVVTQSWRMIMDNAGLSVGGQIIINKSIIEPAPAADGTISWDITPLKQWLMKDKNSKAQDAFHVFEFPNHQNELAAIFNMARQMADEESGIPPVAEGESGPTQTQTAHGMEMLMNNHNIVMRRAVKNWDDNITIPNITRAYDWNMQNNPRNDIKGDFSPQAKGSTALLQKETQSRNMLNLVNFLMTPAFAGWVNVEETIKKLVTSMQHDPNELIKTKAEYDKFMKEQQEAQAAQPQPGNNSLEVQKMKNDLAYKLHQEKLQESAADRQFKAMLADSARETEMLKLAQVKEISLSKIAGDLQKIHEKSKADRTLMADEFKVKLETGSGL
jgi:hypothetical protein